MNNIIVSPSLLSFDFSSIGAEARELERCGAPWLHCDVMDGVFVPNITFGIKFVSDLRKCVTAKLDVHLMIVNPENYIGKFVSAGADIVTVHLESTDCVMQCLTTIRQCGALAGLSIKPDTPVEAIAPYLDACDLILIMSVYPGFGGQAFIADSLERIKQARQLIGHRDIVLQVDGGIDLDNARSVTDAGANCLVAGSAIYKASNRAEAIRLLAQKGRPTLVNAREKMKNRLDR